MVTLLYGIAIGIVLTMASVEIRLMIARRRLKKEQERFKQALDGFGLTIRQFFHGIEDDLEQRRKEGVGPFFGVPEGGYNYPEIPGEKIRKELTIDEKIHNAIAVQNYELAAKLRDERDAKIQKGK